LALVSALSAVLLSGLQQMVQTKLSSPGQLLAEQLAQLLAGSLDMRVVAVID
jgi:hypothetical protein